MQRKCLIPFLVIIYTTFVVSHIPGERLLASIERLEELHKDLEDETKILRKRASLLLGNNEDSEDDVSHTSHKGGNYVRWGRTICPESSSLIYKGYAGGSFQAHTGAAANYLCLPSDPQWSEKAKHEPKKSVSVAYVYGSEYQLDDENVGFFGDNIHHYSADVPCSVCMTEGTNILMIPGRTTCYDGWRKEYTGYLVAGKPSHIAASEYICLDENPEAANKKVINENGKLFYLTVAKCGSLPCPPYVDGTLLSCVVCTM